MYAIVKNKLKLLPKVLAITLFLFLFAVNIKVMVSDEEVSESGLSLFGVKVGLSESTIVAHPCNYMMVEINEYVWCSTPGGNCCGVIVIVG